LVWKYHFVNGKIDILVREEVEGEENVKGLIVDGIMAGYNGQAKDLLNCGRKNFN
jgi:hypothetical protein